MGKGYTHSNIDIRKFDVVLSLPTGFNSFQHQMTILLSIRGKRKEKIKRIFK